MMHVAVHASKALRSLWVEEHGVNVKYMNIHPASQAKKRRQENMMRHISPLAWQVQPWERPQCLECLQILVPDSMKLKSKTKHWDYTSQTRRKPVDFFRKKYSAVMHNRVVWLKQHLYLEILSSPPVRQPTDLFGTKSRTLLPRN